MVVVVDRQQDDLHSVAPDLPAERTLLHQADVSGSASVNRIVEVAVGRFGKLDVSVTASNGQPAQF